MRKQFVISFIIVLLFVVSIDAATIKGLVLSEEDNSPLPNATVRILNNDISLKTDADGKFEIKNVELPVTISFSYVGFITNESKELLAETENIILLKRSYTVLNSYVVTANRYQKEAYKVSQPITSVSSEEIINKGYTIVSDVIRTFPGVDMNDAGPFRSRPVIRGLFGTRILVLVDGERLNDQRDISEFAGVSMSLVDVSEIERIEVVNGPSSVLYGSDAMGGIINIITKKNKYSGEPKIFARYNGRYSTADEQHSNRIDLGYETEKWSFSGGYQYREANNDFAPPDGWNENDDVYNVFRPGFYDSLNNAQSADYSLDRLANSQVRVNNYDFKAGYKINSKSHLDFDFGMFRTSDIGYAGVPNDSTPFLFFWPNHDRDNFSLSYTGTGISDKMARIEGKIYYQKISKDFFTNFYGGIVVNPFPGASIIPLTSASSTEVTKIGLNFQELYKLNSKSTMTFGFDAWQEEITGGITSYTLFEGFGPTPFVDTTVGSSVPENNWKSVGVYASGEFDFEPLTLNAGLRFDNFWVNTDETDGYLDDNDSLLPTADETYNSFNGSLGAVYSLGDGINLVGNIGTAYRVPNVVERFFYGSASGRQTRPNPDIQPEKSVSIDYGVKAVHTNINYSLMGFWSDYKDFTQLKIFGSGPEGLLWRFENVDDVTIYGFEAVVEGNFSNGTFGSLTFSYQHGQNKVEDQPLFVSPVKTTLSIGHQHKRHGFISEFTIRRVEDQNRIANVTYLDDIATKGFTVVNFTNGIDIFENVRLTGSINNIFDVLYSEPFNGRNPDNPIPESGRNFIIGINAGI